MGLREKIQQMNITVVRIIAISVVILSFLAALEFTHYVGKKFVKGKGRIYPLLMWTKKTPLLISKGGTQLLKRSIGKTVTVEGRVSEAVSYSNTGTVGLRMGALTLLILPDVVEELRKEGKSPEGWKGLSIDATGKVRFDPVYGFQMIIDRKGSLRIVNKR